MVLTFSSVVDHDVARGDAVVGCSAHDLLGDGEAHVGVDADAGLVVADGHHRCAVLGDERQHALHLLVLARHRVDQRLALVDGKAGLEGFDDRRVDGQRHVGDALHELDGPGQQRRLVGQGDAGVDVEHVRTGSHLGQRVGLDAAEVAVLHLLREQLATGGVDALADHHEGPVEADHDFLGGRADDGVGHDGSSPG